MYSNLINCNARQYAQVGYPVLRDKRLSLAAKGCYAQLQALPPDFVISAKGLSAIVGNGRESVRRAIVELEQYGYLVRAQRRTSKGRFDTDTLYITMDEPGLAPELEEFLKRFDFLIISKTIVKPEKAELNLNLADLEARFRCEHEGFKQRGGLSAEEFAEELKEEGFRPSGRTISGHQGKRDVACELKATQSPSGSAADAKGGEGHDDGGAGVRSNATDGEGTFKDGKPASAKRQEVVGVEANRKAGYEGEGDEGPTVEKPTEPENPVTAAGYEGENGGYRASEKPNGEPVNGGKQNPRSEPMPENWAPGVTRVEENHGGKHVDNEMWKTNADGARLRTDEEKDVHNTRSEPMPRNWAPGVTRDDNEAETKPQVRTDAQKTDSRKTDPILKNLTYTLLNSLLVTFLLDTTTEDCQVIAGQHPELVDACAKALEEASLGKDTTRFLVAAQPKTKPGDIVQVSKTSQRLVNAMFDYIGITAEEGDLNQAEYHATTLLSACASNDIIASDLLMAFASFVENEGGGKESCDAFTVMKWLADAAAKYRYKAEDFGKIKDMRTRAKSLVVETIAHVLDTTAKQDAQAAQKPTPQEIIASLAAKAAREA